MKFIKLNVVHGALFLGVALLAARIGELGANTPK
jgi:hypothetical protein